MDALALIPQEHTDGYWIGSLSMALALTVRGEQHTARSTLEEFLRSPLPSAELKRMLREELKA